MALSVFDDRAGLAVKPHHARAAVLARKIVEHGAHQIGHDLRQLVAAALTFEDRARLEHRARFARRIAL